MKLQEFGIWVGIFFQLSILGSNTRIFARLGGVAIPLPSPEKLTAPPLPREEGSFTVPFSRPPSLVLFCSAATAIGQSRRWRCTGTTSGRQILIAVKLLQLNFFNRHAVQYLAGHLIF